MFSGEREIDDETSFVLMKYAMRQCSLKNTLSEKGALSLMSAVYDDPTGTLRGRIEPGSVSGVTIRCISMDKVLCPLYL